MSTNNLFVISPPESGVRAFALSQGKQNANGRAEYFVDFCADFPGSESLSSVEDDSTSAAGERDAQAVRDRRFDDADDRHFEPGRPPWTRRDECL
jgi:hypothetical protein